MVHLGSYLLAVGKRACRALAEVQWLHLLESPMYTEHSPWRKTTVKCKLVSKFWAMYIPAHH